MHNAGSSPTSKEKDKAQATSPVQPCDEDQAVLLTEAAGRIQ